MQHSLFNLLASCKQLTVKCSNQLLKIWLLNSYWNHILQRIEFRLGEIYADCFNIQFCTAWKCNIQFSSVVFGDLIIDDNNQFSICLCKIMGWHAAATFQLWCVNQVCYVSISSLPVRNSNDQCNMRKCAREVGRKVHARRPMQYPRLDAEVSHS